MDDHRVSGRPGPVGCEVVFEVRGIVEEFRPLGDPLAPVAAHLTLRCEGLAYPLGIRFRALIHGHEQLAEILAEHGRNPLHGRLITLKGLPSPPVDPSPRQPWLDVLRAQVSLSA